MAFKILRPQIKTLLETVPLLHEVAKYPKIKFSGYPAAHVIASDNSADYETNKENIRTYAFLVRAFYETKNTGVELAMDGLEEVVDALIDLFDMEDMKGSDTRKVGINLPTGYTYINIWATPGRWLELPEDQLIMAEISVRIRISRDVS